LILALLTASVLAGAVQAQTTAKQSDSKEAAHKKDTVAQHRAIAKAHEEAAKCLEAGKGEEACHKELQDACKGLAIGKYCGMRHSH
jgi:hypothetical protein